MTLTKALSLAVFASALASAGTITFTETILGSGSLDGTSFTNQLVTLTLTGDTGSITSPLAGVFLLIGPASVTVNTVGSDTFSDAINAVDNQGSNSAGFGDETSNLGILFTTNAAFGSYALNTSIGPFSGASVGNPGSSFATTGGTLVLSGPFNVDHPATFSAVLSSAPEPGTLGMLGAGIGLLALARRFLR